MPSTRLITCQSEALRSASGGGRRGQCDNEGHIIQDLGYREFARSHLIPHAQRRLPPAERTSAENALSFWRTRTNALPGRMVPTLMILVAPPAVAFTAWLRFTGEVGNSGHFLLSVAYVFALLVMTQWPKFRTMPFALSWWALSFPLAALSIASFAEAASSAAHRYIGTGLLVLLMAIVVGLIVRTALAMRAGTICVPE